MSDTLVSASTDVYFTEFQCHRYKLIVDAPELKSTFIRKVIQLYDNIKNHTQNKDSHIKRFIEKYGTDYIKTVRH